MIALILTLLLAIQGAARPQDTGTITGVIKNSAGEPAAGVRVTAVVKPDNPAAFAEGAAFASLAETDEAGRYKLENIPPGNYYVAAGRVGLPTYFPGTLEMPKGSTVAITPAATLTNINFTLDNASLRQLASEQADIMGAVSGLTLPVQVRMEGDIKQPVLSENGPVLLRMTRGQGPAKSELSLTDSIQNLSIPSPAPGMEFRFSVENLPKGYAVRSMVQDGVDLMNGTLKLSAANFSQMTVSMVGATAPRAFVTTFITNAGVPMTPLEITIAAVAQPGTPGTGVRVSGRAESTGNVYLSLSGMSGVFFADGSFEFRGVPPGWHTVMVLDKPVAPSRTLAAVVYVRNSDVKDVLAEVTMVQPSEIRFPERTSARDSMPLAWLRGSVVDEVSKEPVFGGRVTISGKTKAEYLIDSLGLFEIPRLLPGVYELTVEGFQHAPLRQSLTVGVDDIQLDIKARAN